MTKWQKNYFVSFIINWLQEIISFILHKFGNTHHPCDASRYKERNQNIYSTLMVGITVFCQQTIPTPCLSPITRCQHVIIFIISMQARNPVREDISKLKDDVTHFKQELMVCILYIGIVHSMVFAIHQKTP